MPEKQYDQWRDRDLPVLRAIVEKIDTNPTRNARGLTVGDVALLMQDQHHGTGTTPAWWTGNDTVRQAFHALRRGEYIVLEREMAVLSGGRLDAEVLDIKGKAYEATGAWPSAEDIAAKLIAALEDLAEYSDDPVEKSRAKKAAAAFGGFSRDTLVSVIGAATGVALQ